MMAAGALAQAPLGEAPESPGVESPAVESQAPENPWPESLAGFDLVAENEALALFLNEETVEFAVLHKESGRVWHSNPHDRQRKEIAFARMYAKDYAHGTDGHSRLVLISLLVELLDQTEGALALARLRAPDDRSGIEEEGAESQASLNE